MPIPILPFCVVSMEKMEVTSEEVAMEYALTKLFTMVEVDWLLYRVSPELMWILSPCASPKVMLPVSEI